NNMSQIYGTKAPKILSTAKNLVRTYGESPDLLYLTPWRNQRRYNHREHSVGIRAKERTITPLPHPPLNRLRDLWSSRSPFLLFAIKSALAAGFSWEIVSSLLGVEAAALAVVSAVIVVQVTGWQTVRKSIE